MARERTAEVARAAQVSDRRDPDKWLKAALKRANNVEVYFSVPMTPYTFCHSYIMHLLYHRQPVKVIQALAGHKEARSIDIYTRVIMLDIAATLNLLFCGQVADAAAVLRSLPPA